MKSYCTDAENWHLHLAMFLTHKQCVVETEQMSAVEMTAVRPQSDRAVIGGNRAVIGGNRAVIGSNRR